MAKLRANLDESVFNSRRPLAPSAGSSDDDLILVRASLPATLLRDLSLHAVEQESSVSDLLISIVRRAIPPLKIVPRSSAKPPKARYSGPAGDGPTIAGALPEDAGVDGDEQETPDAEIAPKD